MRRAGDVLGALGFDRLRQAPETGGHGCSQAPASIRSGVRRQSTVSCTQRVEASLTVNAARRTVMSGLVLGEDEGRDRLMLHQKTFL